VDDLNALYDPLRLTGRDATERRRLVEKAKARMLAVRSAVAWSPERYEAACWEMIQEGFDAPEDAFGPAIILTTLANLGPAARRWLGSLPSEVVAALEAVDVYVEGRP
jgi:hypothetical protein